MKKIWIALGVIIVLAIIALIWRGSILDKMGDNTADTASTTVEGISTTTPKSTTTSSGSTNVSSGVSATTSGSATTQNGGSTIPPAPAGSTRHTVDLNNSLLEWTGTKTLISYRDKGTIDLKSGHVDVKDGKIVAGQFVMDMTTIVATYTDRSGEAQDRSKLSGHLKSADFFDVAKYPESKFVIKSVTKVEGDNYTVSGDLTIKGITQAIAFNSEILFGKTDIRAKGQAVVDRTKFGIRWGSGTFFDNLGDNVIGDTFTLDLSLVAKK